MGAALLQGVLAVRGEINQISNAKRYIAYTQFLRKSVSLYLRRRRAVRRARRADGDHGRNRKCRYAAHAEPRGPAPAKPAVRGTGSAVCAASVVLGLGRVLSAVSTQCVSGGHPPLRTVGALSWAPAPPPQTPTRDRRRPAHHIHILANASGGAGCLTTQHHSRLLESQLSTLKTLDTR